MGTEILHKTLELTKAVSEFMEKALFKLEKGEKLINMELPPPIIDIQLRVDAMCAARIIYSAKATFFTMPWAVDRFTSAVAGATNPAGRAILESLQLEKELFIENNPCVIVDNAEKVLGWFLPDVLGKKRRDALFAALAPLESLFVLNAPYKAKFDGDTDTVKKTDNRLRPGCLELGLGYQPRTPTNPLRVHSNMGEQTVTIFLQKAMEVNALVAGILRLINPELYHHGMTMLRKLASNPRLVNQNDHELFEHALGLWNSPFSALTILSNCDVPSHIRQDGCGSWFDIIVALGYQTPIKEDILTQTEKKHDEEAIADNGVLEFRDLGVTLDFLPGTMVAFSTKIISHGIACKGDSAQLLYMWKDGVATKINPACPEHPHFGNFGIPTDSE